MAEITVAGKKVTVRTSFRGREFYSLPGLFRNAAAGAEKGDCAAIVPFLTKVVTDWEFAGDPADPAAYEDLDTFQELLPLANQAFVIVAEAAFPPKP